MCSINDIIDFSFLYLVKFYIKFKSFHILVIIASLIIFHAISIKTKFCRILDFSNRVPWAPQPTNHRFLDNQKLYTPALSDSPSLRCLNTNLTCYGKMAIFTTLQCNWIAAQYYSEPYLSLSIVFLLQFVLIYWAWITLAAQPPRNQPHHKLSAGSSLIQQGWNRRSFTSSIS